MGRHGADREQAPDAPRPDEPRFSALGPVTDPFLLDGLPDRARATGGPHETAEHVVSTPAPARSRPPVEDLPARPRAAAPPPAPWAPRPVVRRTETPFSGPIALPDPEDEQQPPAPPTALHAPDRDVQPAAGGPRSSPSLQPPTSPRAAQTPPTVHATPAPSRPLGGFEPDEETATSADPPRSLPALIGTASAAEVLQGPAAQGAQQPAEEEDGAEVPVGLSVRTLLLSLGIGVVAAVALSVVAVLPI